MKTFIFSIFLSCAFFQGAEACTGKRSGQVGDCAPDFKVTTQSGQVIELSSLKGKVVFLNFWATWCRPCIAEIPDLEKLNQKLKGQPFEMVALSIDTDGQKAIDAFFKKFFNGKPPAFPNAIDTGKKISHQYGTFKVPETFIIDKNGKITDKFEGIRGWSEPIYANYLKLLTKAK